MPDLVADNKKYVLSEIFYLSGKERAERLRKLFAMKKTGERDAVDPYADFVASYNAYAAYTVFSGKPYLLSKDELEKKVMAVYCPDADSFGEGNENIIANIAQSIVGLVLAWNGGADMEELIMQRLFSMHKLIYASARIYKEPSYKFGRDVKDTLCKAINHSGSTPAARGEACLRMAYFLYRKGYSEDSLAIETDTIRAVTYRIDAMNDFSQKCAREYLELLRENKFPVQKNENGWGLGIYIRHFDGHFKDYEKVFGVSRDQLLAELLKYHGTAMLAHRILRAFFVPMYSSRECLELCEKYMTNTEALESFRFYHICEEMFAGAKNASTEDAFFEQYDEVINNLEPINDNGMIRKALLPMSGVFNIFFVRGWNVKRLVESLGDRNICKYSTDNKPSYNDIEDGAYGINAGDLEDIFFESRFETEDVIYYYINTIMHKVVDFRAFVERIADLTNGNVKEALADYCFRGKIVRLDAKLFRKGFYNVEPYNLKVAQGYRWMEIQNAANAKKRGENSAVAIDEAEQNRRCKLTLMSDEKEVDNSAGHVRFVADHDDIVDFKISYVDKKQQTYKNCYIYISDMKRASKQKIDTVAEANASLDKVADYLKTVIRNCRVSRMYEPWKKSGNTLMTPGDIIKIIPPANIKREGERNNRSQEFAMLFLRACEALKDNQTELEKLLNLFQENFIDDVNEFFYKPGIVKQLPYIKFDDYKKVIQIGNNILGGNIPFELKMRVYMNTCLKMCYYLEKFTDCNRAGISSNPFLYNEGFKYKNYVFLLKPNSVQTDEEEYSFSFFTNIKSNFGNNIVISKQRAIESGVTLSDSVVSVFGEVDYIDYAKGKIVLKCLVADSRMLKGEAWKLYVRQVKELHDIGTAHELQKAIDILRKIKIDTDVEKKYLLYINEALRFMQAKNYEPEMTAAFFTGWKGWIENEKDLFLRVVYSRFKKEAKDALQKLIERAGSEDDTFVKSVLESSFLRFINA